MFTKRIKWYLILDAPSKLDELFLHGDTAVLKTMFGEFLLVKHRDSYLVFDSKCPHQGKSLQGSWIEDEMVICPWHQYHYSCENGRGHGLCLNKHELKIDQDGVFIGVEKISLF